MVINLVDQRKFKTKYLNTVRKAKKSILQKDPRTGGTYYP